MTIAALTARATIGHAPARRRAPASAEPNREQERGQWWRFALILVITVVVLVPIVAVVLLSSMPAVTRHQRRASRWRTSATSSPTPTWSPGSATASSSRSVTVVVAVAVAAPAGYVLSRGRSKAVSGYSLLLFVIQSLPVITAVIPLFILFAELGLVDNLIGSGDRLRRLHHVRGDLDDGGLLRLHPDHPRRGGLDRRLLRVRLLHAGSCCATPCPACCPPRSSRSCSPGTTTSSPSCSSGPDEIFTLPIGLQTFFQQNTTDWGPVMAVAVVMMLPPGHPLRRPEQVLQRRRHRRLPRRKVVRAGHARGGAVDSRTINRGTALVCA